MQQQFHNNKQQMITIVNSRVTLLWAQSDPSYMQCTRGVVVYMKMLTDLTVTHEVLIIGLQNLTIN